MHKQKNHMISEENKVEQLPDLGVGSLHKMDMKHTNDTHKNNQTSYEIKRLYHQIILLRMLIQKI